MLGFSVISNYCDYDGLRNRLDLQELSCERFLYNRCDCYELVYRDVRLRIMLDYQEDIFVNIDNELYKLTKDIDIYLNELWC